MSTVTKLIEKYMKLQKEGYETMTIPEVVKDLRNCQRPRRALTHTTPRKK